MRWKKLEISIPIPNGRYSIATLFTSLTVAAIVTGVFVNRTDFHAETAAYVTGSGYKEFLCSRRFIDGVLAHPIVSELQTVRVEEDPDEWIREHLRIEYDGTGLIRLRIQGNSFRDKTSEFRPLLEAVVDVLFKAKEVKVFETIEPISVSGVK